MLRPRRLLLQLTVFILLCIVFIGPWPVSNTHFRDADYAQQSLSALEQRVYLQQPLPLQGGFASIEITPKPGVPLGGYSARNPKANEGSMAPVYAKAISLSNGEQSVTIVGAEILLPLPELVDEVVKLSGVKREQLYFTTSHTHSGPGGYAKGLVAEASLGEFHPDYFQQLSQALATIVKRSRSQTKPVRLRYQRLEMDDQTSDSFIYNQLNKGPGGHHSLHWLQLSNSQNQSIANLISFSAHPTFLGRVNKKISGDYPGLLQRKLEQQLGSPVMFAVGSVGGMLPVGQGNTPAGDLATQVAQMEDMSDRLTNWFLQQPHIPQWQSDQAIIDSAIIPVTLPSPQFRIHDNWRLSPLLVGSLFHDRETYVHALRLGPLFLFAEPADYSGELAQQIEKWGAQHQAFPWITGFNGDYIGYIMPSNRYDEDHYTVGDVNFFGRWAGDYLNEINKKFIEKATGH